MNDAILAAVRLPMTTLLALGAGVGLVLVAWSFSHWRGAVKMALVVALFEGALRKWGFPQGQELVYFLKDVFLFGAYLKFFLEPDLDVRSYRLRIPGFAIVLLCLFVSLAALNPNIQSVVLSLFGLKVYFYYLPLIFMMPFLFRSEAEMIRQLTWYVLLALPICLLGLAQWQAGGDSILNVYAQYGSSEGGIAGFGFDMGNKARITGTFSYLTGHTTFVIFFITLCLVLLTVKETRWKWMIAGVILPLLAVNGMMGGSRASIYAAGLVLVGMALPAFAGKIGPGTPFKKILAASLSAGILMGSYWFYEAFLYMSTRTRLAGDTFYERTIGHTTTAISYAMEKAGIFGFGLGLSHPATSSLKKFLAIKGPAVQPVGVEAEPGQVWMEVGVFGFVAWYVLRFLLIWLCWRHYTLARSPFQKSLALAALLLSIPYLAMQVVINHTANILLCALYGLAMLPSLEPLVLMRHRRQVGGVHGARESGVRP